VADLSGDPRIGEYARLIVERCIGVQPGWTVNLRSTPLARPLLEELMAEIGRKGAYAHLALSFELYGGPWALTAPEELLPEPSPVQRAIWEGCDAFITVWAPENTRDGADLPPERKALLERSSALLRQRTMSMEVPWTICEYPTPATAQDAGMTLGQLDEFVFGACLLDWDAEERRLRRIADRFDAAHEVRVVGGATDLTLSLEGREGAVDDGRVNMPGGEVFYSPVETAVDGVVTFSEFPAVYYGHEVVGARLRFEGGTVVDASADSGEEFLLATLDTDEGARRLGEFGIGCNPGIQQYTKNVGFDEKIDGTVHFAVGKAYVFNGGTNDSAVHWDLVKDLRTPGSRIECDGEVVQTDGRWLF
jgi:aminopeptidase